MRLMCAISFLENWSTEASSRKIVGFAVSSATRYLNTTSFKKPAASPARERSSLRRSSAFSAVALVASAVASSRACSTLARRCRSAFASASRAACILAESARAAWLNGCSPAAIAVSWAACSCCSELSEL